MTRERERELREMFNELMGGLSQYRIYIENMDDKDNDIEELHKHLLKDGQSAGLTIEKIKVALQLFNRIDNNDISKILEFIDNTRYGWHGDKYNYINRCFQFPKSHCKQRHIVSYHEQAQIEFENIHDIFLKDEFGRVFLCLFCYCLAALLGHVLNLY